MKLQCQNLVSEGVLTLHSLMLFQQLQLIRTHAATTSSSVQPTASSLSLVKAQSDAIREISLLAGIALLVVMVTQRCPLIVQMCVVVVRMPQDGSEAGILLRQTV